MYLQVQAVGVSMTYTYKIYAALDQVCSILSIQGNHVYTYNGFHTEFLIECSVQSMASLWV